jgi:hypothetical protein
VSANEALRVVNPVALPRLDRFACEIAANIGRELFDGAVTMLGFFAQSAHDDRIDIADQPTL